MYALIIPAYKPEGDLLSLARESARDPRFLTVVIDDGSGAEFREQFASLPESAVVISHRIRKGVGASIKEAMRLIRDRYPACEAVATVNHPARYRLEDAALACDRAKGGNKYVLGTSKSTKFRFLLALERKLFAMAAGKSVRDVRAGLRAFSGAQIDRFLELAAWGEDYDMEALMCAARSGMRLIEVDVEPQGHGVESNSWSRMKGLYRCSALFLVSSLFAWALEYALLVGLQTLCMPLGEGKALLVGVVVSRVVSCVENYVFNRIFVFGSKAGLGGSFLRYVLVSAGILAVNYTLLHLLHITLDWPLLPAKMAVETCLFFVNFILQSKVVYRETRKED